MQIAALPVPVYRAANSRPTLELSPEAANRLTLIKQWDAMRGEGITAAKAADILRVPRASLYRWKSRLRERGLRGLEPDSAARAAVVRQGQDRLPAAEERLAGFRIRRRAHPRGSEAPRRPARTAATRRRPPQASPQAPLRHPQAEHLPANHPRRPRPDRHARRPPLALRDLGTLHRTGRRLPLRCLASGNASDLRERRAVPRCRRGAHALPRQGAPGGRSAA